MILQALADYADTLELTPSGYEDTWVHWYIELDGTGHFRGFTPLFTEGKKVKRGRHMPMPVRTRAFGIVPLLLADKTSYVLGLHDPLKKGGVQRTTEEHRQFKDQVERCWQATQDPTVEAVGIFLDREVERCLEKLPPDLQLGDVLTFRVDGVLPTQAPVVRRYWQDTLSQAVGPSMICLVCGETRPVEVTMPLKVKGIPGGQSSGTALISANTDAFTSYGLTQSLVAPTCRSCGERFGKALNYLLRSADQSLVVGPIIYLFWRRAGGDESLVTLLKDPPKEDVLTLLSDLDALSRRLAVSSSVATDPAAVRSAFNAPRTGHSAGLSAVSPDTFYALALSASGGRAVVREWFEQTVQEALMHLRDWFVAQSLVDPYGSEGNPLGVFTLASACYREARDVRPATVQGLITSALRGQPIPRGLLSLAVERNRLSQGVTRPRAALIKMALIGMRIVEEEKLVSLDTNHQDAAYHCGRLMAQLENIQRQAVPGANQTLTDRYYGTASTAPAQIFGVLLKGAQNHLSRLRRDRRGAYEALERALESILGSVGDRFPSTLDLTRQGLFALGYYHQRAANRAAAGARKVENSDKGENE